MNGIRITCPICYEPLESIARTLKCKAGHSFDIAREGYVNLLNANSGKQRGDSKQMVQARHSFLEAGYYQPLSDRLNALAGQLLSHKNGHHCVVDAGCGTGYYLNRMMHFLGHRAISSAGIGFDLSKSAVHKAAMQNKQVRWFVADSKQRLLLPDNSASLLLNIFAPRNLPEFERILQPCGAILCVIPSETHLAALRSQLKVMGIEADKESRTVQQFAERFTHVDTVTVEFPLQIDSTAHIVQLVNMTPFSVHMRDEQWRFVQQQGSFQDTVSCKILLFKN